MESSVIDQVLDRLIQTGLVHLTEASQPEDERIEIIHESLIHNWPYYQSWLEEEELKRYTRWRLAKDSQDWVMHGRPDHLLLQKWRLEEIKIYQNLTQQEAEFIQASKLMIATVEKEEEKYKIQVELLEHKIESIQLKEKKQRMKLQVLERELEEIKLHEANQSSRLRELEKIATDLLVQKKRNQRDRLLAIFCLIIAITATGIAILKNIELYKQIHNTLIKISSIKT